MDTITIPKIGRFITIDDLSYLDPDTINGLNLYAYCGNNPVMNVDPNGKFIISFFAGLIISFAVGFTVSAVSQGIQYGWNNINYWQASVDGLFAVASTALAATGIGTGLSIVIGMGMSFGQYAIDSAFHGESLTWQGAIFAIALGGFFSGAGATNAKVLAKGITGKAVTGMKAVITTVIKYGKNSVQYKKIMNLYGKVIAEAVQDTINKVFTKGTIEVWISTIISSIVQLGIQRIFG